MTQPMQAAPAATRLTHLIKRIEMAVRARMEEVLRPHGVSPPQYAALSILEQRGGLSSAQLARRHFVTPQAANQMIALLERDRLIERRPYPVNRKVLRAWLTERGKDVLEKCDQAVGELEEQMLAGLTTTEALEFRQSLERTLTALARIGTD